MARYTDTRIRVREVAERLALEGKEPTPADVRKGIGYGSMSTVVDELRQWKKLRKPPSALPSPNQAPRHPPLSSGAAQDFLAESAQLRQQGLSALQTVESLLKAAADREAASQALLHSALSALAARDDASAAAIDSARKSVEQLNQRLDGMQRHMLLQVNEAREQATHWRDKYLNAKQEMGVWRGTLQGQVNQLRDSLAWERGRQGKPLAEVVKNPVHPAVRVPDASSGYPGHPRAVIGIPDDDEPGQEFQR